MAWPTDSWICSASCSAPRIKVGLAGRARRRRSGAPGPRRRPGPRAASQVDLVDQLPATRAVLPACRRVRPPLRLAVADGGRRDAGAALADVLVDAVAFARHEPLRRVPDLVERPRRRRRRAPAWSGSSTSRSPLSASDTPSGSIVARAGPRSGGRLAGDEVGGGAGDPRAGGGDRARPLGRRRWPAASDRSGTA